MKSKFFCFIEKIDENNCNQKERNEKRTREAKEEKEETEISTNEEIKEKKRETRTNTEQFLLNKLFSTILTNPLVNLTPLSVKKKRRKEST